MSLSPAGFIYGITMQKIKNITMHKDVKTELFFLQFHAHTQSKRRGTLCGLVLLVNFRSLLAPIVCRWCTEGGCFAVGSLQMTCVSAEARSCCGPLRLRPRAGKQHNCLSPVLGHRPYRRGRCVRVTRTHGHAVSAARSPSSFHHTLTPRATSSITSEETH